MATIVYGTCQWCGRQYDRRHHADANTAFCSNKCYQASKRSSSSGSSGGGSSGAGLAGRMYIIIPAIIILVIIGLIGIAINGIKNALSDTKIEIVSASCYTEDEFVSIVKKAVSGTSITVLEGEAPAKQQAYNAVIKREGEYGLFKDAVYFVRLPDGVNVYLWFTTKDQVTAFAYKKQ